MITVKILGGLGNQLSAFACGYSIAKMLNEELILDVADYSNGYTHAYALDALNIPLCRKLTYAHASEKMLTPEVIPGQLKKTFDIIVDESEGVTNKNALLKRINKGKNIYLNGYWANYDFFSGDEDAIRLMFALLRKSDAYGRFLDAIREQCSVAIHMRRTDFVHHGNVCSDDYYRAAIAYVQSIHPDAMFYFFSDDIDYAKEHFGNKERFRYIQIFGGMDANLDEFFCISACNHRILSKQSSFSAWASFLNNFPDKIDVIYAPKDAPRQKAFVYLDDKGISELKANYNPEPRFTIQDNMEARMYVESLLSQGQYQDVLNIINEISMDAYSVKRVDCVAFLAGKAIASAQIGNLITAEQCLHKQAQYTREDENFHANCYVVLRTLGRQKASAIHGARCATLTQSSDLRDTLDNFFLNDPTSRQLYKTIKNTPKKHFIIAPNSPWFYYIKTPQSIAALLAKMGHSVSYIVPPKSLKIEPGTTADQIVNACLEAKFSVDSLYSYGFYAYPSIIGNTGGQSISFVEALIEHLSRTQPDETVVVFRHPRALPVNREGKYAKFIYWDFQHASDSERSYVNVWDEGTRENMCRQADHSIIMDREFYQKTQEDWHLKNASLFHYPLTNKIGNYQFIQERIPYSQNYLNDDRTMELASFMLKLTNA
jgi:hypothetical protein